MLKDIIRWALIGIPVLFFTAISYPLAPIVVLFEHNGRLPRWLCWFQTYDHNLYGGLDWQAENPNYTTYCSMVRWLWRNPAGTFSYTVAGIWPSGTVIIKGNSKTQNTPNGHSGKCLTRCKNSWLLNYVHQWGQSHKCLRIVLGWKLYYEQDYGVCRMSTDPKTKPAQWVMVIWPLAGFNP